MEDSVLMSNLNASIELSLQKILVIITKHIDVIYTFVRQIIDLQMFYIIFN